MFKVFFNNAKRFIIDHRNEIEFAAGIIFMGVSVEEGIRNTPKAMKTIEANKARRDMLRARFNEAQNPENENAVPYSEEQYKKDVFNARMSGFGKVCANYITTLGSFGLGAGLAAHAFRSEKLAYLSASALATALAASGEATKNRIREDLGEDGVLKYVYGAHEVKETKTIVDDNGKEKKITEKKMILDSSVSECPFMDSFTIRINKDYIARMCCNNDPKAIRTWFTARENELNVILDKKGHMTVMDVIEHLDLRDVDDLSSINYNLAYKYGWLRYGDAGYLNPSSYVGRDGVSKGDCFISFGEHETIKEINVFTGEPQEYTYLLMNMTDDDGNYYITLNCCNIENKLLTPKEWLAKKYPLDTEYITDEE